MTLREAITAATQKLASQSDLRADASRDAEFLILHALGIERTVFYSDPHRVLPASQLAAYEAAVERRLAGEPIQYITGRQEFFGLALKVTPAVLIPRPETELLVEAVLERLPKDRALQIIDVGTGSGAIAIALAWHLPLAQVTAVDLEPAALEVARENAGTHHLQDRIEFVQSDLLEAVGGDLQFDAIVSNPPYITYDDRDSLHRQVRDHEPASALFAEADGLGIYNRLIPQACLALKHGGRIALEIGHGQRAAINALLSAWEKVEFLDDLQGIPRVAIAVRAS